MYKKVIKSSVVFCLFSNCFLNSSSVIALAERDKGTNQWEEKEDLVDSFENESKENTISFFTKIVKRLKNPHNFEKEKNEILDFVSKTEKMSSKDVFKNVSSIKIDNEDDSQFQDAYKRCLDYAREIDDKSTTNFLKKMDNLIAKVNLETPLLYPTRVEEATKIKEIASPSKKNEDKISPKNKKNTKGIVKASEKPLEEIVAEAPAGLRTDDIFRRADTQNNKAQVLHNDKTNTDVVIVTDGSQSQVGSIWSTPGYRIDLTKSFHAKMKLYFGQKEADAADGMAFVLQNDPQFIDSNGNSNALGKDSGGASLGLMGRSSEKKDKPWENAIQNSYAVEFDTHKNSGGLDRPTGEGADPADFHIAGYYPSLIASYKGSNPPSLYHARYSNNFKTMNFDAKHHQANGSWHDFEINYDKKKNDDGTTSYALSYTFTDNDGDEHTDTLFEDKNEWATEELKNEYPNDSLELNRLGVSEDNPYIYWGFTGATGSNASVNAIVFEELPDLGGTKQVQDVKKVSKEEESVNHTTDIVKSGDELFYEYQIDYDGGKQKLNRLHVNASLNEYNSLAKEGLTQEEKDKIKVTYTHYDGSKLEAKPEDFDVITDKGSIQFDGLGPLGPESDKHYFKSITIRVPFIADKTLKLTEPTVVKDNFKVRQDGYKGDLVKSIVKQSSVEYTINPFEEGFKLATISDRKTNLKEGSETSPIEKPTTQLDGMVRIANFNESENYKVRISGIKTKAGEAKVVETPVVKEDTDYSFLYGLQEDDLLIADSTVTYELVNGKGEVLFSEKLVVLDGTPPEGELHPEVFTEVGKVPEKAAIFVKTKSDSNPSLTEDDIKVSYQDMSKLEEAVKTATAKDEKRQVDVILTDKAGNTRSIGKENLTVLDLETNPWMETKDLTLQSKDLIKNAPDINEPNPDRELISPDDLREVLLKGVTVKMLDPSVGQIVDVPMDTITITGLPETGYQPGIYTLTAKGTVNKTDLEGTFKLTVTDGKLSLSVSNNLDYEVKINSEQHKRIQAGQSSKLTVEDGRYAADGWGLSVSATQFSKDGKKVERSAIDLMANDLTTGEIKTDSLLLDGGYRLENQSMKKLESDLANPNDLFSVELELTNPSSSWARANESYKTTLNWNVTPVKSKEIDHLTFATPVKKGDQHEKD